MSAMRATLLIDYNHHSWMFFLSPSKLQDLGHNRRHFTRPISLSSSLLH